MVKDINKDIKIAQWVCEELKKGNNEVIEGIYQCYYPLLLNYARKRLYNQNNVEDVIQDFWIKLINTKAICNYKGKSSLSTYLIGILDRQVKDKNKKPNLNKAKKYLDPVPVVIEQKPIEDEYGNRTIEIDYGLRETHEDKILQNEMQKEVYELTHQALSLLAKSHPDDAKYIEMYKRYGLTYKEIAAKELGINPSEEELKRKNDAIKKQVTRPITGSMARLKTIVERLMKQKRLTRDDIFN